MTTISVKPGTASLEVTTFSVKPGTASLEVTTFSLKPRTAIVDPHCPNITCRTQRVSFPLQRIGAAPFLLLKNPACRGLIDRRLLQSDKRDLAFYNLMSGEAAHCCKAKYSVRFNNSSDIDA